MRRYVRTPSGLLGIITLTLIVAFSVTILVFLTKLSESQRRTECVARELAQPWIGLKKTFGATPGDPAAREEALKAITRGINRLENVDRYC